MYKYLTTFILPFLLVFSCQNEKKVTKSSSEEAKIITAPKEIIKKAYGFTLNDFEVVHDTVSKGDFFGSIMDKHGVTHRSL